MAIDLRYNKTYLTKAKRSHLSIKILSKISDISKIRVLIYRLDIQTKIVSFPDQEKLLKEVMFSFAVSMNANTKKSQIKHCPCPKYVVF